MQSTEKPNSPVDHLLRGIVPSEVVDVMQNPEESRMGEEPMPSSKPSETPRVLKPGENLPQGILLCCEDIARNSNGLMIAYGLLDNLWVTSFPAQYNMTAMLILHGGIGSFNLTMDIIHEDGTVSFSMPAANADVNPMQKFIMYQQLHGWPILRPGRYKVIAKADGHVVGTYPVGVFEKSVKSVDTGAVAHESK